MKHLGPDYGSALTRVVADAPRGSGGAHPFFRPGCGDGARGEGGHLTMGELRRDPISGQWVIIAAERAARPHDFRVETPPPEEGFCPFCEGNEGTTPEEVMAYRREDSEPNGPGWRIRVVPNKYPALTAEGDLDKEGLGVYDRMRGVGRHEIVIESPQHVTTPTALPEDLMADVIRAYRDRSIDLMADERFSYLQIFKNVGQAAGASLRHSHSQLMCTPVVPKRMQEEMGNFEAFYEYRGRCPMCDIVRQELADGERVVDRTENLVCFTPFASRFPFEMWIVPRSHIPHFYKIDDGYLHELARLLQRSLKALEKCLEAPPYNYVVHSAPFPGRLYMDGRLDMYHWHLEIIPRVTRLAGFEWGTEFYINPAVPEDCAGHLRNALSELPAEEEEAVSNTKREAAGVEQGKSERGTA